MLRSPSTREKGKKSSHLVRVCVQSDMDLHPELQYVTLDTSSEHGVKVMTPADVSEHGKWGKLYSLYDCKAQEPNNCFFVAIWAILIACGNKSFETDRSLRDHCISKFEECNHKDDLELNQVLKDLGVRTKAQALTKLKNHCFMDTLSGQYLLKTAGVEIPFIVLFSCGTPQNVKGREDYIQLKLEPCCIPGTIAKVAAICNCPFTRGGKDNNHFVVVCGESADGAIDYFPPEFEHHAKSYCDTGVRRANKNTLTTMFPFLPTLAAEHYSWMPTEIAVRCIQRGIQEARLDLDKDPEPPIKLDLSKEFDAASKGVKQDQKSKSRRVLEFL